MTSVEVFLSGAFACACWLLGVDQAVISPWAGGEEHSNVYLLRLLAFGLIILAIADKNWGLGRR